MNNTIQHLEEVDHSYIRYANVWEDPILLLEGLDIKSTDKVLSIASAGDNAFALLTRNPSLCVAIDLNKPQLYLTELKREAIKLLSQEEYIGFVGFKENDKRWEIFQNIASQLSESSRAYWENKRDEIEKGVVWNGKFEKYLASFANKVLPLIHGKKKVGFLFKPKSSKEQKEFFDQKWNTWRWKLLFKLFFNKRIMGFLGRDPAFLAEVKVNVAKTILKKAADHISSVYAQENPILFYCLNGNFGPHLPFYCQKVNYEEVKKNIGALEIEYGYAQDAGVKYGMFDRFNLSNIFEYMPEEIFKTTAASLINISNSHAKYAYWNLMVNREIETHFPEVHRVEDHANWASRDQGFFYMQYIVNELT